MIGSGQNLNLGSFPFELVFAIEFSVLIQSKTIFRNSNHYSRRGMQIRFSQAMLVIVVWSITVAIISTSLTCLKYRET